MKKNFFDEQSDSTFAKIKVYKEYLTGYLPKLLMQFSSCIIIDMFCGSGKNGNKKGSPLILLDTINYITNSKKLVEKKSLSIKILFNDQEKLNISKLEDNLKTININKNVIGISTKSFAYETYVNTLINKLSNYESIPKFIFLDPFSYSNVKINELKLLMSLKFSEVLLFLPIFHSYRFAGTEFKDDHKTRKFVEEFTMEGIYNYENIYDFTLSVKKKIRLTTKAKYVRPILIDAGGSKNSLFLLTNHRTGAFLMNKIAFKNTDDGNSIKIKNNQTLSLFDNSNTNIESIFLRNFTNQLVSLLKEKNLTNEDIIEFTASEGFLPKNAKEILSELYNNNQIIATDNYGNTINNKMKWNIAEKITKTVIFKWISN